RSGRRAVGHARLTLARALRRRPAAVPLRSAPGRQRDRSARTTSVGHPDPRRERLEPEPLVVARFASPALHRFVIRVVSANEAVNLRSPVGLSTLPFGIELCEDREFAQSLDRRASCGGAYAKTVLDAASCHVRRHKEVIDEPERGSGRANLVKLRAV